MIHHPGAPQLEFQLEGAEAVPYAAAPLLALKLRIEASPGVSIHSILLRCQVQIEATRRRYGADEQVKLYDLFGKPQDWGRTLRGMMWTTADVSVPGFTGGTVVQLPLPCSYDFNLATVKYFDALQDGHVPLCLLFSGTVFYAGAEGGLQVAQIPWEKEARFQLPVQVWRDVMEHYYPNTAWLSLQKDIFDRLLAYKRQRGLPTWEQTIEHLLLSASGGDSVGEEAKGALHGRIAP